MATPPRTAKTNRQVWLPPSSLSWETPIFVIKAQIWQTLTQAGQGRSALPHAAEEEPTSLLANLCPLGGTLHY